MGASSEKWIAPEHRVRHRHVPAVRISSMPWMDAEHAGTPRTAVLQQRERLVSMPAARRPTAPWLESAGTPRVSHHHLLRVIPHTAHGGAPPFLRRRGTGVGTGQVLSDQPAAVAMACRRTQCHVPLQYLHMPSWRDVRAQHPAG